MYTATVTLNQLIEDTLDVVYRAQERPTPLVVGANALTADLADTTFTLSSGAEHVNAPCLVENGFELILVTGKTADATPVFTGSRAYAGTPIQAANSADTLLLEPEFPRHRVRQAIVRCFQRMMPANGLPALATETYAAANFKGYVELPANTLDVRRVALFNSNCGEWEDLAGWQFQDSVGSVSSTGKLLSLTRGAAFLGSQAGYSLQVTRVTPYTWSGSDQETPAETATVAVPFSALDVVPLGAAAYRTSNRELSRLQLDKVEEWTQDAARSQGLNLRLVQQYWTEFYKAVEEARMSYPVPRPIIYRKRRVI